MKNNDALEIISTSCVFFLRTICVPMPHLTYLAAQIQIMAESQFFEFRLLIKMFFADEQRHTLDRNARKGASGASASRNATRQPHRQKDHRHMR